MERRDGGGVNIIAAIADAWGWKGLHPESVVDQNSFGNLIVRDLNGKYWRICPEELTATMICDDTGYDALRATEEFERDWQMRRLHDVALDAQGPVSEGRCYCLKIPAVLGGAYEPDNIGTIALEELISSSGDLARQIEGLQDGAKVKIVIGE